MQTWQTLSTIGLQFLTLKNVHYPLSKNWENLCEHFLDLSDTFFLYANSINELFIRKKMNRRTPYLLSIFILINCKFYVLFGSVRYLLCVFQYFELRAEDYKMTFAFLLQPKLKCYLLIVQFIQLYFCNNSPQEQQNFTIFIDAFEIFCFSISLQRSYEEIEKENEFLKQSM